MASQDISSVTPKAAPLALALFSALSLGNYARNADAAVHAVTNCTDAAAGISLPGSLRYEILIANPDDTIDLTACKGSTITLHAGALSVPQGTLTILGAPQGSFQGPSVAISGGSGDRVFNHSTITSTGTLNLEYLVIQNGRASGNGTHPALGGCVYSNASVALTNDLITGCNAYSPNGDVYGGAVYVQKALSVSVSTIAGNTATSMGNTSRGGGAYSVGPLTVSGSTISGNIVMSSGSGSADGGGIGSRGSVSVSQSTLSGNSASGDTNPAAKSGLATSGALFSKGSINIIYSTLDNNYASKIGGAIYHQGPDGLFIGNSTISENTAGVTGGGIYASSLFLHLANDTIAYNYAMGNPSVVVPNTTPISGGVVDVTTGTFFDTLTIQSSILANNGDPDTSATAPHDLGVFQVELDNTSANVFVRNTNVNAAPGVITVGNQPPMFSPLAYHGGYTRTLALLATSPALNAGNNSFFSFLDDQRGQPRTRTVTPGNTVLTDMGAYQRQDVDDEIFYSGLESMDDFHPFQ